MKSEKIKVKPIIDDLDTPMQWRWIEEGTAMPAGDLGIWPIIVKTEEKG